MILWSPLAGSRYGHVRPEAKRRRVPMVHRVEMPVDAAAGAGTAQRIDSRADRSGRQRMASARSAALAVAAAAVSNHRRAQRFGATPGRATNLADRCEQALDQVVVHRVPPLRGDHARLSARSMTSGARTARMSSRRHSRGRRRIAMRSAAMRAAARARHDISSRVMRRSRFRGRHAAKSRRCQPGLIARRIGMRRASLPVATGHSYEAQVAAAAAASCLA